MSFTQAMVAELEAKREALVRTLSAVSLDMNDWLRQCANMGLDVRKADLEWYHKTYGPEVSET